VKGPQGVRTRLGIPAAVDSDVVVWLQDVMPTILEACGLEPPTSVDGRSVLPALADPTGDWRAAIHGEHSACYDRRCEMQYLTDGRQKYISFAHDGSEQLFDLTIDPYEEHDLAADPDPRRTRPVTSRARRDSHRPRLRLGAGRPAGPARRRTTLGLAPLRRRLGRHGIAR